MVTFAFTDIEGSTKRWEHDSTAMQGAVACGRVALFCKGQVALLN